MIIRILKLPPYCRPEEVSSSHLSRNLNDAYKEAGFITQIYCPTPTRGIPLQVREQYKKIKYEECLDGHLIIHRFSMFREGKNSILRAARYILVNIIQYFKGIHVSDIDVIWAQSTPPTQGFLCALVKKRLKVPYVYNLQDIFPDSLVGTGLAKKGGLLWKIGRRIENFTYKYADKIIVISEDFKKNIMAKGVPEEKIIVIYNWVDQNAVVDIPREENKLFDKYGLDRSKFYVTYNGNIGLTQNMDMLLAVAEDMKLRGERLEIRELLSEDEQNELNMYKDIQFVLVGNGAYLEQVKQIVADRELNNIHLLPFQPYEDISHVFSLGDVSLVISKPGVGANSVPSKTWSIMSASRPVLANFDPNELKDILNGTHPFSVNGERCGIFTEAGDKVAFTDAIIQLYKDRDLCKKYGENGRHFVMANLTREVGTQKYVDVIKSVAAEGRG